MSLDLDKSNWHRVKFGDVIDSISDRVDDPSAAGVDRYVGLEHLDPGVLTVVRWDSPHKVEAQKLRFQPGDVIFGRRRAYQKKVARADFEGICSAHALVLRAKPGLIDPDFLPVFLASDYFLDRAIAISVGSLSPTVNWRDLKVQEFALPPLPEQKKLAELLWTVEKHSRSLQEVEAAQGIAFEALLGQHFAQVSGSFSSIAGLCTSVVGGIWGSPEGEKEVDVLALGPRVYASSSYSINLAGSPTRSISRKQAETRVIEAGDIILERSGGTPTQLLGRVVYADSDLQPTIPTDFQRLLRPDPNQISPRYLFWLLHNDWVQGVPRAYSKRTTNIGNLTVPDYLAREVAVPTNAEQEDLLAKVEVFENASKTHRRERQIFATLRSSLLNEIFGGN